MDENPSVDETTIPSDTEVVETTGEETVETPESTEPEVVPKTQYDSVHKRATRAEAELKTLKGNNTASTPQASSQSSIEETVLLANGMSEELVKKLKSVAKVEGYSSLLKAQNDPIFVAVKDKFEQDKRQKEASLGASRGAGSVKAVKKINSTGLTRDEHRAMVLGQ